MPHNTKCFGLGICQFSRPNLAQSLGKRKCLSEYTILYLEQEYAYISIFDLTKDLLYFDCTYFIFNASNISLVRYTHLSMLNQFLVLSRWFPNKVPYRVYGGPVYIGFVTHQWVPLTCHWL